MIALRNAGKIALVVVRSRDIFGSNARFEVVQIVRRR